MEITVSFHPWGLKITILGANQVSRKMGAYQAERLRRGENVQNRQLQTCLNIDVYTQSEAEWQEQLELREEAKNYKGQALSKVT